MKIYKMAVFLVFLIGGCTPKVADWTPAESPKENVVDRAIFTHFVHYSPRSGEMGKVEKKRLQKFLKRTVLRPSAVTVILEEYGEPSEKRLKDVKRELFKFGIPYELITEDCEAEQGQPYPPCSPRQRSGTGVEIIVERYVVTPPSCADFSQPIGDARQQYSHSNFGCADVANFGMMVANPRDLVTGRPLGESDGQVIAAGVDRYRKDKVKELLQTSTNVEPGSQTTGAQQPATSTSSGGAASAGAY